MKILLSIIKQHVVLTISLFFLLLNTAESQQRSDYFFQKLNTLNGLSSNYILCIIRDSRGYVWIGTSYGLNRYDGKNIKVYHHDAKNPRSLPREGIYHIEEDKTGNIWIDGGIGLTEFNPFSEQFTDYQHDERNLKSLAYGHTFPFIDSKNNVWVFSEKKLQLFDRRHRTFETILPGPGDSVLKNPSLSGINAVAEDKEHNLWCGGSKGLYKFDPRKRELKLFPSPDKTEGGVSDLLMDHEGNFRVVYWKSGINLFHPGSGIYESIPSFKKNRFSLFGKMCEWRDPSGVYWLVICTERGLLLYNCKTGEKKNILNDPLNSSSLINNDTYYVYTDKENTLWIGTKKGLNILDNSDQSFHSITISQGSSEGEQQLKGSVETIFEDPDLKMVSFMWTKGLGIYTHDWQPIRFYSSIPPSDKSMEARNIYSIYKDVYGIYWIATEKNLVRFDRKKNLFNVFIPVGDKTIPANEPMYLREIIPFDSTSFYVRSKSSGIYKFNFIKKQFVLHLIHKDNDPASLPGNNLKSVKKDDKNRLIIISANAGIFIYNPENNTYEIHNRHPDANINEALTNLNLDPSLDGKTLWLNSASGLLKFDLPTKQFELFNSRNGLLNDYLLCNEVDDNGNVWVAHNAGISKFDISTHTFTNYTENNGLVFQELNSSMKKMENGNIYIGDNENIIYFNPYLFKVNQNVPQVHINSVQVLNEPYKFTIDTTTKKKSMILSYDQELITVNFSVLNFSHSKENGYYYRLNLDSAWHKINEGSVNLVRLSPGKYVLYVTGSNDSGVMNPTGDSLSIRVLPPYYQTWWFRVFIIAGIALIVFVILRARIKTIKDREHLKTEFNRQLAQAETKALRAQMNPHFIFNSLNSINSFVMEQKHEMASDYLIKFSKLIRLILDNSRSETISIEKELETLRLYVLLESARFENKFKCAYHIAEDVNTNSVMIPPMLLQPFVENAIWHGLMQKEGEGNIIVEIKKENEELLNISITDDGIGREKASELKSKSATHKSHGLKVTSQRIEMMNKLNSTGAQVHVIDLKDEDGNATGTKVELIIPF